MKLAKIYGIEIKLHLSTLLIIGLIGFYAANFYSLIFPSASLIELFVVGIISGLIILVSILIHELAHSIVAQKYGLKVSEIELYLFGGVSKIEEEPNTPKSEMIIAAVGPLSSLIIGAMFLTFIYSIPIALPAFVFIILLYTGISNISLGVFNLIPAFPIDGGRILRAYLWSKRDNIVSATKTASKIGTYFAYGLIAYGIFQIFLYGFLNGLWLIIIGFFLSNQTKASYFQILNEMTLSKINARDMVSMPRLAIPFNMMINDAIREYFMLYKKSYFPVIQGDKIVGIIHIEDIKKTPIELRANYIVGYAMRNISDFPTINELDNGKEALKKIRLLKTKPNLVVVKNDSGYVLGLIGKDELSSSLRFCKLNPENC
ncbi:MAG: site-2 protease family protein [Promethearchaeota archaeon]